MTPAAWALLWGWLGAAFIGIEVATFVWRAGKKAS